MIYIPRTSHAGLVPDRLHRAVGGTGATLHAPILVDDTGHAIRYDKDRVGANPGALAATDASPNI